MNFDNVFNIIFDIQGQAATSLPPCKISENWTLRNACATKGIFFSLNKKMILSTIKFIKFIRFGQHHGIEASS